MSGAQGLRMSSGQLQERAQALIDARRYEDALSLLARAIASDPDNFELHCLKSRSLMELGRMPEALQASDAAARLAPEESWPFTLRSSILIKLDRGREALVAARQAARLCPQSSQTQFQLAVSEWLCWHRRAGRAAAERVLELAPDESSTYELLAWFDLGLWRFRSAERYAREALRLDPQSWQAFNYLGQALRAQRKGPEAIEALIEGLRLNPADTGLRYQLMLTIEGYLIRGLWPILPGLLAYVKWMDKPNHPQLDGGVVGLLAFLGVVLAAAVLIVIYQRRLNALPADVVAFYKFAQRHI